MTDWILCYNPGFYSSCSIRVGKSIYEVSTSLQNFLSEVVKVLVSVYSFHQSFDKKP